jgi:hypothetical protein
MRECVDGGEECLEGSIDSGNARGATCITAGYVGETVDIMHLTKLPNGRTLALAMEMTTTNTYSCHLLYQKKSIFLELRSEKIIICQKVGNSFRHYFLSSHYEAFMSNMIRLS